MSTDAGPVTDVVVAHDYLTQRGGAERVALEIARQLRAREVVTSVYAPNQTFAGFDDFPVRESGSRALKALRGDMRRGLPLLASAWSRMAPVDAEALVCSSSGWSHGLRTTAGTRKIVYCHNPARWLYQRDDYLQGQTPAVRVALNTLSPALRSWDRRAAGTADAYLANSDSVADRIYRAYGIRAQVVHPPLALDAEGAQDPVEGVAPGYFLTVFAAAAIAAALVLGGSSAALAANYPAQVGCVANPATIVVGETSVVTCSGLSPNATGTFTVTGPSGTVTTRSITTDAQGNATFSLVGPAAGDYQVSLVTSNGQSGSAAVTVTAVGTATGDATGGLPPTGTDVPATAIWLGVGAIGIGGVAVAAAVARRRAARNR